MIPGIITAGAASAKVAGPTPPGQAGDWARPRATDLFEEFNLEPTDEIILGASDGAPSTSRDGSINVTTRAGLWTIDDNIDGVLTFDEIALNILPAESNVLSVTLNGSTVTYTVPANATVASVVTGLAARLSAQSNATRVRAYPTGDRLELQSLDVTVPGSNVTLSAGTAIGAAAQLTTLLTPARASFLNIPATGYLSLLASNAPVVGDWLRLDFTKTNGAQVTVSITNNALGTTIATLLQNLLTLVNSNPALQSADGVLASDFGDATYCGIVAAQLTLYARSPGWPASQLQVAFTASMNLLGLPSGTNFLQDNLTDLRPRNHLYVSSGAASLPANFVLDTTVLPDGFHQLTAVASEGTSVRTQTRISRDVRIQNTGLTATFTPPLTGTNATLDMPLQFTVTASATNIARLELFGTGGSVAVVSNQPSAVFTIPSAALGLGLHPFYALVTDTAGNRYQTQTDWIRLFPSLKLSISGSPLTLSWPAIPGERYDVLAKTNLGSAFQTMTSLVASNAFIQWSIPAPAAAESFYRVSWIRLIPSFKLSISGSPLTLSWPAIPGQRYDVLAKTNLVGAFQTVTSIVASNDVILWLIPAPAAAASFYRVRLSP